jgi:Zn-dependent protease
MNFTSPQFLDFFVVLLVVYSTSWHELAHAFVATWLGDPTPGRHGRLTFDPLAHLKPPSTAIFIPFFTYLFMHFLFCLAFTPINPSRFRRPMRDRALVSVAGPLMNLAFMGLFVGILWIPGVFGPNPTALVYVAYWAGFWNLVLAVFNMMPLPPLDGYWIARGLLPLPLRMKVDAFAITPFMPLLLVMVVGMAIMNAVMPYVIWFYQSLLP